MSLIVDCSVALAWSVASQSTPLTQRVQIEVQSGGAIVPFVFPIEIGNALIVLERRRRMTAFEVDEALDGLNKLDFDVDLEVTEQAAQVLVPLAREHQLTLYDAAYLELARRTGLPLATRDKALAAAVRSAGAKLFEA